MTRKILIAGEGSDELGRWYRESPYRHAARAEPDVPGLLEALLHKLDLMPFEIVDGAIWKRAPLFRAGDRRAPETRRVLGLALLAKERDASAVVFVRDRDGDEDREADIEAGVAQALALGIGEPLSGGVAVEEIEAWVFAMLGDRNAERYAHPKEKLIEKHGIRSRAQKVAVIKTAAVEAACEHAPSLVRFCKRVRATLARSSEAPPSSR